MDIRSIQRSNIFYPLTFFVIHIAHFLDLFISKFSISPTVPPLRNHVHHIIGSCSDKQVGRIDAWRHIAFMQYFKSIWDAPMMKFIRKTVRGNFMFINTQSSVAISGYSYPYPALFRFEYIFPESSNWIGPTTSTKSSESDDSAVALRAFVTSRILAHMKAILSCVMPPVVCATRRFFINEILTQGMVH